MTLEAVLAVELKESESFATDAEDVEGREFIEEPL